MAEVYGVKPKIFTKEWWPYYWMYYKWHTIGTAFAVICIVITLVQCMGKEKYDVTVNYAGAGYISDAVLEKLEDSLEEFVTDIDNNGEKNVFIQQINLSENDANAEMVMALQTKHDISLSEDTHHLYIYDKAQVELMAERKNSDEIYLPVSEWYNGELDDSMLFKSESGEPLAISLKNSTFLKEYGIDSEELYIAVKYYKKNNEINMASYKSAVAMAEAMIK